MRLPNGFGSIHKLSGKRRKPWRVRKTDGWTDDRKQKYINIGCFATQKEALEALTEFNKNPWDIDSAKITFAEVFKLTDKKDKMVTSAYNQYCKPIYDIPINKIKTMHLQDIINNMSDKSVSTKKKTKQVFNQVFKYAYDNDLVNKNYAMSVTIPDTVKKEKLHKAFTTEQLKDMFSSNDYHKEITLFLCMTGYRIDEALQLENENINFEKGTFVGGIKTDAGKDRIIPISKHVTNIIKKYYDPNNKYLFQNLKTKDKYVYTTFRYNFNKIYKDNTSHDGRHTFSTLAHNAEISNFIIEKLVGHSSGGTFTERTYTHKDISELKKAIDKFDNYIDENILN